MTDDSSPDRGKRLARASAWMALGTITSRVTGFVRLALLAWTIGAALDGDIFNSANTLPNAAYILVAGGVFNVVLVPQLVRAMKRDPDGGETYAQRIITLGLLVMFFATTLLTLCVPVLMRLVVPAALFSPEFDSQRQSAELLMYLCMPQVFFYGAFVLVGQVLNARERFGPMMWAPVLNNLVACTVIVGYLVIFGSQQGADRVDGFSTKEALLLGVGHTVGIAAQFFILIPYLRAAGFHYRPRWDFRGVGLGHTARLGAWTLLFISANQVAFVLVNRIALSGTIAGADNPGSSSGSAVYDIGFLISQVPHGVITVSLATAIMPSLSAYAADRDYRRLGVELARTTRITMSIVAPLAVAVACLGGAAAAAIAVGALADSYVAVGQAISMFSLAMVAFTAHYLMLRGFYADENTKVPAFIQVGIASANVALAVALTWSAPPEQVAGRLALAYGLAYCIGLVASTSLLSRRVGPMVDAEMVRFMVRLGLACGMAAAVMIAVLWFLDAADLAADDPLSGLISLAAAGVPGAVSYLIAAKLLRMEELGYLVRSLRRTRTN